MMLNIIFSAVYVAIVLFGKAMEYGIVGVLVYILAWTLAFPVMLIVCLVGGVIAWASSQRSLPVDNSTLSDLANRLDPDTQIAAAVETLNEPNEILADMARYK